MISLEAVLFDHRILTTESEPETLLLSYPEQQLTWKKSCWIELNTASLVATTRRNEDATTTNDIPKTKLRQRRMVR